MQQSGQTRLFAPYTDEVWQSYDTEGLGRLDKETTRLIAPLVLAKLGRSKRISDEEFDTCYNSLEFEGHILKADFNILVKFFVDKVNYSDLPPMAKCTIFSYLSFKDLQEKI